MKAHKQKELAQDALMQIEALILEDGREIRCGEDPNATDHTWVSKVRWNDGTESYAKSWATWDAKRSRWQHDHIGIGAYGDTPCWTARTGWIGRHCPSSVTQRRA